MKKLVLGGESLITGAGSLEYLKSITASRAFIVTGSRSTIENGTIDKIKGYLGQSSITTVFSGINKNPDTTAILAGLEVMREFKPDLLIAVGGGSPLDAAKVMALFYEYPQINFNNFFSVEIPERRRNLKFIAIPTTSGTGSEVTKAAVVTFKEQNLKIGLKTMAFIPDVAILDAALTLTMPDNVVAETGLDAVTHAVEAYVNNNLDDFTEVMAKGAIEGLLHFLPISYHYKSLESREKVHHYQCLAGYAFDNVGLGLAHGIAHAIGGKFDLGHGLINAIALPYVLEYNSTSPVVKQKLENLARSIGANSFTGAIKKLNAALNIPSSLSQAGLSREEYYSDFSGLVENSLKGSTRLNPVIVSIEDMAEVLTSMYEGRKING
ncbi:iron-containing alcohol dehydrogenase [Dendrosporobacter sp. 1207_IL3150]|uniref:iron-containing alcohol dehydrogenase n=1 Tax=Dendrosporobacter sp. 1207_IL3150 TaxID=3084054 RepID=UPI002FD9B381